MKTESLNKVICCVSGVVFVLQAVGYLAPAWFVQEVLVLPDVKGMHADSRHFLLPFLYQKADGTMSLLGGQALLGVGENDIKTQETEDPSLSLPRVPVGQNNIGEGVPDSKSEMKTNGDVNAGTNIGTVANSLLVKLVPTLLGTGASNLPDSGLVNEDELNAIEGMITPVAELVKPVLGILQKTFSKSDVMFDESTTSNSVVQEESNLGMSGLSMGMGGLSIESLMVAANRSVLSADLSLAKRQRKRRAADTVVEPDATIVQTNVDPVKAATGQTLQLTTQVVAHEIRAPPKAFTDTQPKAYLETVNVPSGPTSVAPTTSRAVAPTTSRAVAPTTSGAVAPTTSGVVAPTTSGAVAPTTSGGSFEPSAIPEKPTRVKILELDAVSVTIPPTVQTLSSRTLNDSLLKAAESKGERLLLYLTAGLWYSVACVTIRYPDMRSDADAMQWCTLYTRIDNDTLENKHNVFELRLESSIGMAFSLISVAVACTGCCTRRHLGRRAISSIAVLFLSGAIMAIPVVHVIVQHVQLHKNVVRQRKWNHVTKNLHVAHDLFDHYSVILCGAASIISVLSAVVFTLITCKSSAADESRYDLESASGFTRSVKKYPVTWAHNVSITVPALTVSKVESKADDSESGYSDIKDDTASEHEVTMHELDFTLHEEDCDGIVATVESGQLNTD